MYDALVNPTKYKGTDLTWTSIRRLASYGTNTFEYGANGIRCRKNNTTYTLDGNRILKETDGSKTIIDFLGDVIVGKTLICRYTNETYAEGLGKVTTRYLKLAGKFNYSTTRHLTRCRVDFIAKIVKIFH